jgi:hypothetical protein
MESTIGETISITNTKYQVLSAQLHQLAADHIQGLLRGPGAYTVTVAGESTLNDLCMAAIGQGMEHQPNRLCV